MKHKLSWIFLFAVAGTALFFIVHTTRQLPPIVASHFDATGYPTAFMLRERYAHFILALGFGLPFALVALLTAVYSRANDMKLPNRDYWLAPERIGQTRDFLVAHGIWFGSLLIIMVCFAHWLELNAHSSSPPHLANGMVYGGLLFFFLVTTGWIGVLLLAFRRPRGV